MVERRLVLVAAGGVAVGVVVAEIVRLWRCPANAPSSKTSSKTKTKATPTAPPESTIRKMTRLAIQHKAVNLSQGFPK